MPAQYCSFINNPPPLFPLKQNATLLNEKWESLALLKAYPSITLPKEENEYFLFSFTDNDYVTTDGIFP